MPVRLKCKCEAVLALHERYVGRKARCPECRWEFVVPPPQPGVDVVPTSGVQAYGGRSVATTPTRPKGPDLDFKKFQEMLGHTDEEGEIPSLPEDLAGGIGPREPADLSPEKTATEIIVERAFGTPQAEYDRLKELLESDNDAPHLHSQLGDVCLSLGRREEAIKAYDRAIQLDRSYDYLESKIEELLGPQEYAKRLATSTTPVPKVEPERVEDGVTAPPPSAPAPVPAEPLKEAPSAVVPPPPARTPAPEPEFSLNDILLYPLRSGGRISILVCALLASGLWYGANELFVVHGVTCPNCSRQLWYWTGSLAAEGDDKGLQAEQGLFAAVARIVTAALCCLGFAYVGAFHLKTITSTARNEPGVTGWPGLERWWEDILRPVLFMLFHLVLCIVIPARILAFALPITAETAQDEAAYIRAVRVAVLLAMGFFYLPMTAVLASLSPGVSAMNPLRAVIGMFQAARQYVVALFLFALCLGSVYLTLYFGRETLISFPLDFPLWMASFYFSLATARALGRLYLASREELGWEEGPGMS
jgi:hypothetical protein